MPKVKNIEKKVWDIEGFSIRMKVNGRDIRSDKNGLPQYQSGKASRNNWTVAKWKRENLMSSIPDWKLIS